MATSKCLLMVFSPWNRWFSAVIRWWYCVLALFGMALLSRRWIRAADRPSVLLNLSVLLCKYLSRRVLTFKGCFLALGSIYIGFACMFFYDKLLSVLCTFTVSQCGQTTRRDQLWRVYRRAPGQRLGQPQRGEFTASSACLMCLCRFCMHIQIWILYKAAWLVKNYYCDFVK